MWGSPPHLESAARVIQEVKGNKEQLVDAGAPDLHVLVAVTNANDHTYDGFDNCGERVAQEVSLSHDHPRPIWAYTVTRSTKR